MASPKRWPLSSSRVPPRGVSSRLAGVKVECAFSPVVRLESPGLKAESAEMRAGNLCATTMQVHGWGNGIGGMRRVAACKRTTTCILLLIAFWTIAYMNSFFVTTRFNTQLPHQATAH